MTTTNLIAYHGDAAIKRKYLARVRQHRAADQLVKGHYWEDGKGCAVGCTIHGSDHGAYERELGIPRVLARLEDSVFEGLPNGKAMAWPERFLIAVKAGADLSLVWPRLAIWMLADESEGVIRFAKTKRTREAVSRVAALWQRVVDGEAVESLKKEFAAAAAYAAAAYAAAAAAAAAYAYAAAAAAYAADAAAAYAAAAYAAAAYAADAYAEREAFWNRLSDKLIELMGAAPIASPRGDATGERTE